MKRLLIILPLVILAILYGYFGAKNSYDVEMILHEQYNLTDDYLRVSSNDSIRNVNNRITRVFEVYSDGTWGMVDLKQYDAIVDEYGMLGRSSNDLALGVSEPLTATSKVDNNDTAIGQFDSPISLASKFVSEEEKTSLELTKFEYRIFDEVDKVIVLKSKITFDAGIEKTITLYFKPYVRYESVASDVMLVTPAHTKKNVVGYIEVRSN